MTQIGSLTLTLLLDARLSIAGDSLFAPASRPEWQKAFGLAGRSELDVAVTALLIRDGKRLTLVDTGFGADEEPDRETSVVKALTQESLVPEDITRVVITHAHGDHCAGNTLRQGADWRPAFPQAEYVIQEQELAFVAENDLTLWQTRFQPLIQSGQLRTVSGRVELDAHLTCWPTPGHTIGHQSVLIQDGTQQALCLGDLAILHQSLLRPEWGPDWAWSHDQDTESRRAVIAWALANDALLIAGHDPQQPWLRLKTSADGWTVGVAEA